MRFDSLGMFWEDAPEIRGRASNLPRVMPPIPETGWKPPKEMPNLATAKVISLDTETWDPELIEHGPGWARGKGHIVGISVGADNDGRWYFPIRHEIQPEDNLDPDHVLAWARDTFKNPRQPKIGANLIYDLGWLAQEGVEVKGELVDVQYAEALLTESAKVALDVLGQKYLGEGKATNLLYPWCAQFYGGQPTERQRANIYRAPPSLVGPYAESDADLPMRLAKAMYPKLAEQGLVELFQLECRLIPILMAVRFAGVRVDVGRAEKLREVLFERAAKERKKLRDMVGFDVDVDSSQSLAKAFDCQGIPYGRTEKGAPSFRKEFLESLDHPLGQTIREIRKCDKLRGTFVESYILKSHINGRVYGQFHPLRSDDGGTRSGRFSSSNPNLQNIPARDEELAPLVRGLFIPEEGHIAWRKYDYSQVEYRFLIHFAVGPGSDEARAHFNAAPDTDYHERAIDLVAPEAGWDVSTKAQRKHYRKQIKTINFGLIYGMGIEKLTRSLGLTAQEGKALFQAYHKGVPFAKATMDACSEEASRTGAITTILGRKSRFDLWEPDGRGRKGPALPYTAALAAYSNIRRAFVHKALNRRLQGSAADYMKMAIVKAWDAGLFAEGALGPFRITVHDELDFSDPGGRDEAFKELKYIMEHALPTRIPIRADGDIGPDWGHVHEMPK